MIKGFIEVNKNVLNQALNHINQHTTNKVNDVSEYFTQKGSKFAVKVKDKRYIHVCLSDAMLKAEKGDAIPENH